MRSLLLLFLLLLTVESSNAGGFEISGGGSYSESKLGESSFQWTRRWTLAIGYQFWHLSEIEFAMQDVVYQTKITHVEDTKFHDQVYSIDWVQHLASRGSFLIPYVKVGVGQLNREASGSYWEGGAPPKIYDSLTAVLGGGLKVMVTRRLGLRVEGTSYLTNGVLSTWRNNVSTKFGFSIYL